MVNSKFKLALVILWNENIHGHSPENQYPDKEILSKYFVNDSSISINEFYDKDNYRYIGRYLKSMVDSISEKINNNMLDDYYSSIFINLLNKNIIGLQIIQPIEIDDYSMCIIKTHWIRLIQRRWREIKKKRIKAKKNIFNLRHREIYGKFPQSCNIPFKLGI
jgi:hypothetical protein|uniref:Uncharacterized protein n=1 Tax=viral metagenome TaxID=1070528 RepID=A0A6C0CLB0_9ZZZZ